MVRYCSPEIGHCLEPHWWPRLRDEKLLVFDACMRSRAARVRSDSIPISEVSVTVDLDDDMLRLAPFTLTMARGNLMAEIAIDWRRRPAVTHYDIRRGAKPTAQLLGGFGGAEAGTTGTIKGRIKLTGAVNALHDSLGSSCGRIAFVVPKIMGKSTKTDGGKPKCKKFLGIS